MSKFKYENDIIEIINNSQGNQNVLEDQLISFSFLQ